MDMSNIDIGFDLNTDNPGPEEVELTFDLAASADLEIQDNSGDPVINSGMPNLLKYITAQGEDLNGEQNSVELADRGSAELKDQTAASAGPEEEFSQVIFSEKCPVDPDEGGMTHQKPDPPLPDLLQNESCHSDATSHDQGEPPTNPVLADLITAAVADISNDNQNDLVELNLSDDHENNEKSKPSLASEVQKAHPASSEAEGEPRLLNNIQISERNNELNKVVTVEASFEVCNHGNDSQVNAAVEKTVEDVIETEDVTVTTIRQNDKKDDEEFDFDLPQKKEITFDTSDLKRDLQNLDIRIGCLTVYKEGQYSAEPLETLQESVQSTINDSQSCFSQLSDLQKMSLDIPKEHPDYSQMKSSISSAEERLCEIQRLAQLKHSMVQDRMREQQASLDALQAANADAEPDVLERTGAAAVAAAEWDAVQTVTPEMGDGEGTTVKGKNVPGVSGVPMVTYTEVIEAAQMTFNLDKYKPVIKTSVTRKGFSGFIHRLFGSKLNKNLLMERDTVFCLAACPYQDEFPMHWHVLQTIYRRLTGAVIDCPRYGSHWEQIGFQGNDPATDLRGCGFLALVQLLHMVSDPMVYPLTKDFYKLSTHDIQHFPMCIMGINMTRIVIQTLREDNLNKECNRRKSVFDIINELYVACWLRICQIWKQEHKTITDTGFVMKSVEMAAKKNPQGLIKALNTHLAQHRSTVKEEESNIMTFQAVCDLEGN